VFDRHVGNATGLSFGRPPATPLDPDVEAARIAATDAAFSAVAYITAALALLSAIIAWLTLEKKFGTETRRSAA
jgi:hypothetical protein